MWKAGKRKTMHEKLLPKWQSIYHIDIPFVVATASYLFQLCILKRTNKVHQKWLVDVDFWYCSLGYYYPLKLAGSFCVYLLENCGSGVFDKRNEEKWEVQHFTSILACPSIICRRKEKLFLRERSRKKFFAWPTTQRGRDTLAELNGQLEIKGDAKEGLLISKGRKLNVCGTKLTSQTPHWINKENRKEMKMRKWVKECNAMPPYWLSNSSMLGIFNVQRWKEWW